MKTLGKHYRYGSLALALTLVAAVSTMGCTIISAISVAAEGSFDRSLNVTGSADLEVRTGSGEITVRAGVANVVQVHGTIKVHDLRTRREQAEQKVRALASNPPIEQNGNVIRIGRIEDRELRNNVSISYELLVPADTRLRASTGSGSQTIEGVRGPAEIDTGSGSLTITNILENVKASTGSGEIQINSVRGPVEASTGSGSIRASNLERGINASTGSGGLQMDRVVGDVEVSTGSGSIRVEGLKGSLKAHTGSGNLTAQGEPTREWNLQASSGSISVRLPADAAFDLDARADSGSISLAHPLTVQGTVRKEELRGKVRGGGPMVYVRSGSGSIHIE